MLEFQLDNQVENQVKRRHWPQRWVPSFLPSFGSPIFIFLSIHRSEFRRRIHPSFSHARRKEGKSRCDAVPLSLTKIDIIADDARNPATYLTRWKNTTLEREEGRLRESVKTCVSFVNWTRWSVTIRSKSLTDGEEEERRRREEEDISKVTRWRETCPPLHSHSGTASHAQVLLFGVMISTYRGVNKGLHVLLSRTQEGPGRTVKQEQEESSRNHVQAF